MSAAIRKKPTKLIYKLSSSDCEPLIAVKRNEVWLVNSCIKSEKQWGRGEYFLSLEDARNFAIARCDKEIAVLKQRIAKLTEKREKYRSMSAKEEVGAGEIG